MADPRGENRSYSGYGNKSTGAGSYSNKSGNGVGATSSGSDDKRQKKQGIQVALGNAYYDKNGAYVVLKKPATVATVAKAFSNTRLSDDRIQRANLPSEVAKQYAQPANTRPIFPRSTRTAYDIAADKAFLGNTAKTSSMQSISAAENAQIDTAFAAKRTPKIKTTMGTETTGYGVNNSVLGATGTSMVASLNSTNSLKASPTSIAAYDGESALKKKESASNTAGLSSEVDGAAVRKRGNVDYSKSTSTDPNDGKNLSFNNNTVAAGPDKYNQEYYAKLVANGMSTANILDIQSQAIGGNPYSGATIVSEDQKRGAEDTLSRVTGSMATLQNEGVTRKYTQSGLLGEFVKGEFNWKDGTNVTTLADDPVLRGTFNESTGRIEGGIRLGSRQVTTFAGRGNYTGATAGTGASTTGPKYAVNTMSGGEDGLGGGAKTTTLTAKQSATLDDVTTGKVKLDDIVDSTTIIKGITTVEAVDGLIATTTDPDILKSLYQRRLSLMRLRRTRTRFAGLLDDADTKRTNLMSIS
jgi:hypothetical protein